MKVFIFRFNSPFLIEVVRRLQENNVEILYWVGSKRFFESVTCDISTFSNTIFHDTNDAVRGLPAKGVAVSQFPPLSADLINKMLSCESQVLTMMNAIDWLGNTPLMKRKRIYYGYMQYWYGVLTTLKPDAVIFGDIPHIAYQYVVYSLAKLLGIKVVMYRAIQIKGRMIFLNEPERYQKLETAIKQINGVNFSVDDLQQDIQAYYQSQTSDDAHSTPFFFKKDYFEGLKKPQQFFPALNIILKHIRNGTLLKVIFAYIRSLYRRRTITNLQIFTPSGFALKRHLRRWAKIKESLKKEYKELFIAVDWNKKFIYVPLHNQPEASTSAMGGVFVDQQLMVELLAAAIPDDWVIYVKENLLQWVAPRTHVGRYPGYYEELARLKNVYLIPATTSNYELIKKAQAVATVTGTPGWEAVLRGKPALVFGYIWYIYCDGVFRIHDLASCRIAIDKIRGGYRPDRQKVINFLKAVDETSIHGYPNSRFKKGYDLELTEEENIVNIFNELCGELGLTFSV